MPTPFHWRAFAAIALSSVLCGQGLQEPSSKPARTDLVILHFNDFHGQIMPKEVEFPGKPPRQLGGLAGLKHFVDRAREQYGEHRVWLTNGGDWYQGTPEGNDSKGVAIIKSFQLLGPTATVIGNHEYDFGERQILELVKLASEPILGANILAPDGSLRTYAKPFVVREVHGVRIALVGLIAQETKTVATGPFYLTNEADEVRFANEAETLASLMPQLERESDAVILITHCGLDIDRKLAKQFPKVALILGGHSHTALQKGVREGNAWIVQSAGKGTAISEVRLTLESQPPRLQVVHTGLVDVPAVARGVEPEVDAFVESTFGYLREIWDKPIGRVEGRDSRSGPGSTPGGNYVAAMIREAGKADVGITNKGGIRSTLREGDLTRRDVFELLPFDNSVVTLEISGRLLRETLAQGLARGRRPLEIDGARYSYKVVEGERQLVSVQVGEQAMEENKTYRVAVNSFLAGGGDGLSGLREAKRVYESVEFLRDIMLARLVKDSVVRLSEDDRILFVR